MEFKSELENPTLQRELNLPVYPEKNENLAPNLNDNLNDYSKLKVSTTLARKADKLEFLSLNKNFFVN